MPDFVCGFAPLASNLFVVNLARCRNNSICICIRVRASCWCLHVFALCAARCAVVLRVVGWCLSALIIASVRDCQQASDGKVDRRRRRGYTRVILVTPRLETQPCLKDWLEEAPEEPGG